MKYVKTLIIVLAVLITSCSKDDDQVNVSYNVLGVWEYNVQGQESMDSYKLVFGNDNTGLTILTKTHHSGGIVSSANPITWTIENQTVTVFDDGDVFKSYQFVDDEELVDVEDGVTYVKISENYEEYY